MLLDSLMPAFDATRIEHRVIDGRPAAVYEAAIHADFLDAMRRSRIGHGLFTLRAAAERVAATVRRSQVAQPEAFALRLAEMSEHGDWVRLGEDPPNEFVFGVIGRFWGGETAFEPPPRSRRLTVPGTPRLPPTFRSAPMGISEPCSATRRAPWPPTRTPAGHSCATGPSRRPEPES